MLHLYRRHAPPCKYKSQRYRRCQCPIYVRGSLRGEWIKKSLDLTSWEAAEELIQGWSASGEIGLVRAEVPAVALAIEKFLADCESRKLGKETVRKYKHLLENRLLKWCDSKGYVRLKQIDVNVLREFRASWNDGPLYALKNLERLRAFFRFCVSAGWIKANPALAVKSQQVKQSPTLPFSQDDIRRIIVAAEASKSVRVKALILLMRYSGLRIGDAVRLPRSAVSHGKVKLYTGKTGQHVSVPLPEFVVSELEKIPGEHFFWTGKGTGHGAVKHWQKMLRKVFLTAEMPDGHAHRMRDTFAVAMLMNGLSVDDVAVLLGNSPRIVLKHYSPWIVERQVRLDEKVRATF